MSKRWQIPEKVTFVGGFKCELTADESNAWHEFANAHPAFKSLIELTIKARAVQACICGGEVAREQELIQLDRQREQLEDDLFRIGAEWYASLVASDKEKGAATE